MGEFDYYPDMNKDGKVDSYDRAVFYDLMEEEEKHTSCKNVTYHYQPSKGEAISMFAILCYESLLLKGSIPINGFTMILGLILLVVFLCLLNDTMVPW